MEPKGGPLEGSGLLSQIPDHMVTQWAVSPDHTVTQPQGPRRISLQIHRVSYWTLSYYYYYYYYFYFYFYDYY